MREFKIRLNDKNWSSEQARANGLRRLAIAQLGSAGALDEKEFVRRLARLAIQTQVPAALRAAASVCKTTRKDKLLTMADLCEREPTQANARAARDAAADAAAYTAYTAYATYAARDKSLADFAEGVVQILIDMNAPGCQWLSLTEAA